MSFPCMKWHSGARLGFVVVGVLICQPATAADLRGHVLDALTGQPVPLATVKVVETQTLQAASEDGSFNFQSVPSGPVELVVRHVGYHMWRGTVNPDYGEVSIRIFPLVLQGQEIIVTSHRAVKNTSPVAFDNITKKEIERIYQGQDVPMVLTESPNVYSYSDNGNGIGYSYLSIRGFSQRRVSVLVNGVPLNDPESHEVYWIDLPDLLESVEDVQVQRGIGTTLYGANSIGGTVNLLTDQLTGPRRIAVSSGLGSYDTRRFSIDLNSGLIDDRYAIYGRYSRIVSNGYRRDAWTDLWSYFISAARYDAKWKNQVNVFGGPEQTHLAYQGVPRQFLEGDTSFAWEIDGTTASPSGDVDKDRRFNPLYWDGETDNFNQPQYQLLTEYRPNDQWTLENTLYYIKGEGYYDQRRFGRDYSEYQLTPFANVVVIDTGDGMRVDTVMVDVADQLVRRRWVDNDFWGVVPRATTRQGPHTLTFGGEFRRLTADHWGEILSANPAPEDFVPQQRYYSYSGGKTVASVFAQDVFTPHPIVTFTGALSFSFKRYERNDDEYSNYYGQRVSHTTDYNFISPRFGVTARPNDAISVFGSVSYNKQEPTNDEIFDLQDYYANITDFFADTVRLADGTIEGRDPIMKPERLVNVEFGAAYAQPHWRAELNLYYMRFYDEIVWNGQQNDDGVPIRANAPQSTHKGIELTANADFGQGLSASGNLALSNNTFDAFTYYGWDETTSDFSGNTIALFPERLANARVNYDHRYFSLSGHVTHAGDFYIDNSNDAASMIEGRTLVDLRGEVKLNQVAGWPGVSVFVHVNNLFDTEYETGGYWDGEYLFIPAAKRNFFAGMRATL